MVAACLPQVVLKFRDLTAKNTLSSLVFIDIKSCSLARARLIFLRDMDKVKYFHYAWGK